MIIASSLAQKFIAIQHKFERGVPRGSMSLLKQLSQKKKTIIKKWFDKVVDSYPIDTAQFFKSQNDPFANPVGQTTLHSLEGMFDLIVEDFDPDRAKEHVDPVIRIRSIQDFTPSRAVRFIYDLKHIIRDQVPLQSDAETMNAYAGVDQRIDAMALVAFDIYVQCREKIYDLKANEMRARTYSAFARAGLVKEPDEDNPDSKG